MNTLAYCYNFNFCVIVIFLVWKYLKNTLGNKKSDYFSLNIIIFISMSFLLLTAITCTNSVEVLMVLKIYLFFKLFQHLSVSASDVTLILSDLKCYYFQTLVPSDLKCYYFQIWWCKNCLIKSSFYFNICFIHKTDLS